MIALTVQEHTDLGLDSQGRPIGPPPQWQVDADRIFDQAVMQAASLINESAPDGGAKLPE